MDSKNQEAEHIEKNMAETAMHKHIGNKSPNPFVVYNKQRYHSHPLCQKIPKTTPKQLHRGKNEDIYPDKPIHNAVIPVFERPSNYIHVLRIEIDRREVNLLWGILISLFQNFISAAKVKRQEFLLLGSGSLKLIRNTFAVLNEYSPFFRISF